MSWFSRRWVHAIGFADRTLPWPKPPSGIDDHRAWEAFYIAKVAAATSKLALAQLTLEAVLEDLESGRGLSVPLDHATQIISIVLKTISMPPPGSEPATGLAQGAAHDPASIPESNAKGVYP